MQELTNLTNWVLANPKLVAWVVASGGALSALLEMVLQRYKINSKKLAFTLLHLITIITTVLVSATTGLKGYIPVELYSALTIVALFWHRFLIGDAYTKYIEPYLNFLAAQQNASPSRTIESAPANPTVPENPLPPTV